MLLATETVFLCLLFWLFCYLGTGTDEKNVKSYRSYPEAVQKYIKSNDKLKNLVKESSPLAVFFSNVVLFTIVLFPFGLTVRGEGFLHNFLNILVMGQAINLFDFLMDLIWFRNTKRTRFTGTEDRDDLYRDPGNHRAAFLRGIPAFLLVAVIDGFILSLF